MKATPWLRLALDFLLASFVILLAFGCLASRSAAQTCAAPSSSNWTCNFYQYEIVAQTGETVQVGSTSGTFSGFGVGPSINENGMVAFDGQVSSTSGPLGDTLFMGAAGSTSLTAVSLVLDTETTFDDAVQINDSNQIVALRQLEGPSYHLDVYNGNSPGTFADIADTPSKTYASILTYPSINSKNAVAFSAYDKDFNLLLAANPPLENQPLKPAQPPIRPTISDTNSIVLRDGNTDTSSIVIYTYNSGVFSELTIASSTEFSQLGESPSISRDGAVVAFAGNLIDGGRWDDYAGPGVFVAIIDNGTIIYRMRVAGFHYNDDDGMKEIAASCVGGEGENCLGGKYYLDEGRPFCDYLDAMCLSGGELEDLPPFSKTTAVYFDTFTDSGFLGSTEWENRIAVTHTYFGEQGVIDGSTIVVSFIATPNMSDSTGLQLFTKNSGIWTVRADLFFSSEVGYFAHVYRPTKVIQVGDAVAKGVTVTAVSVNDQLANMTPELANGNHSLGFWVSTSKPGEMILRASYIQQYGYSGTNNAGCCSAGTLGALVKNKKGTNLILSNDHVLGDPQSASQNGASVGQPISAPGSADYNCETPPTVGKFASAPTLDSGVDAALAILSVGQINTTGQIYNIGIPASTIAKLKVGLPVAKQGRTSGLTCGTVEEINLTLKKVPYAVCTNAFTVPEFDNQILIESTDSSHPFFALPGDSGALVVTQAGAQPVGLNFYQSWDATTNQQENIANPISKVASELGGVTFVGGATHKVVGCPAEGKKLLPDKEAERARLVKEKYEAQLFEDPSIIGVGVGAADDNPAEGVIVITVESGKQYQPIPPTLDGIRTKVKFSSPIRPSGAQKCSGKFQGVQTRSVAPAKPTIPEK